MPSAFPGPPVGDVIPSPDGVERRALPRRPCNSHKVPTQADGSPTGSSTSPCPITISTHRLPATAQYAARAKGGKRMTNGEDVPRWHRPISQAGLPLVWLVIGIGVGAFGAQLFSALNLTSDSLRLYTTAVSAGLGALGGAVATMFADRRKDRLSFRRKTKSATIRLERVCLQIETLEQQVIDFVSAADDLDEAIAAATVKKVMLIGLLLRGLADFGKSPPNFDDILETRHQRCNACRRTVRRAKPSRPQTSVRRRGFAYSLL
jgi:hypothetical protein